MNNEKQWERQVVEQTFKQMLADELGLPVHAIKSDSLILDDLGADSLDVLELAMECEQHFSIELPDEDMGTIYTVEDAVSIIMSKVAP